MHELIHHPRKNNHPITILFFSPQYPKIPILSEIGSTNYRNTDPQFYQ